VRGRLFDAFEQRFAVNRSILWAETPFDASLRESTGRGRVGDYSTCLGAQATFRIFPIPHLYIFYIGISAISTLVCDWHFVPPGQELGNTRGQD
jgi:hypothetical protein